MSEPVAPPEIASTVLAAAARNIANAFGLGDDITTEDIWPVDDGDRVLAASFAGAFDGVLQLAVNESVAGRLSSDSERLAAGFRSALAEIAGPLGLELVLGEPVEESSRPRRIAQIRDNTELTSMFGLTFVADTPPEPVEVDGGEDGADGADGIDGGRLSGSGSTGPVAYTPVDMGSLRILQDVDVDVSVELGRTKMSVRDVLALRPGMVIELDRSATAPIDMMVNGRHMACGDVVVIDEEFGIRITEIVSRTPVG